jgi:hypothetical protein
MKTMPPHSRTRLSSERFVAVYLAVSALALVALVVVVVYLVVRVSDVQGAQAGATISSCQASNTSRTEDITVFEHLLTLPPSATAMQKKTIARDLALIHKAYALRDCAAAAG